MPPESQKLSLKEKIGYSLGDTASNLFFQTFILFLPIFYTDVFGLPAAAMGTLFLFTRIFDAANDPVMGTIADRTNTRWGKFRPYLLIFAIPFGIAGVLTFTTPNFDASGKLIYAYLTYNALMVMYTIVNVPYSALMGVMTPNSMERTEVSSFRFVAAFIGGLIVQASTISLVKYFGNGNDAVGWQWAMDASPPWRRYCFSLLLPPPRKEYSLRRSKLRNLRKICAISSLTNHGCSLPAPRFFSSPTEFRYLA